ncbi:MAG: heme NO-binding domain-containing protein [Acidimicrobiales bacterium]
MLECGRAAAFRQRHHPSGGGIAVSGFCSPMFEFSETDNGLLVRYVSARGLSALAEGLIMGCGDLYSEETEIELVDGSSPIDAQFIVKSLSGQS